MLKLLALKISCNSFSDESSGRVLFVKNLNFNTSEDKLRKVGIFLCFLSSQTLLSPYFVVLYKKGQTRKSVGSNLRLGYSFDVSLQELFEGFSEKPTCIRNVQNMLIKIHNSVPRFLNCQNPVSMCDMCTGRELANSYKDFLQLLGTKKPYFGKTQ